VALIGIDFDHTVCDTGKDRGDGWHPPIPNARETICTLREHGHKILIHSCNRKSWIEKWMREMDIPFDYIWDEKGKPAADLYIDDRGYHFDGTWDLESIERRLK
jgi:hypothetical protein